MQLLVNVKVRSRLTTACNCLQSYAPPTVEAQEFVVLAGKVSASFAFRVRVLVSATGGS